jgi:hypothetical protein
MSHHGQSDRHPNPRPKAYPTTEQETCGQQCPSEHKTALLLAPTFEESLQDVMDLRLNAASIARCGQRCGGSAAGRRSPCVPVAGPDQYIDGKNFSIDIHLDCELTFVSLRRKNPLDINIDGYRNLDATKADGLFKRGLSHTSRPLDTVDNTATLGRAPGSPLEAASL